MAVRNPEDKSRRDVAMGESLELVGGAAVIGSFVCGITAVGGEIVERVLPSVDSFPGGSVAKAAGALSFAAVGLISGSHYMQNRRAAQ